MAKLEPKGGVMVVLLQCIMHMSMYLFEHLMTAYRQVSILSTLALQASPLFNSIDRNSENLLFSEVVRF